MSNLRVVGAGMPRTGTMSLMGALEQLLGGPCYHMYKVRQRPDDVAVWHRALQGDLPDWSSFLADFVAAVDWPASYFWRELSAANPDALVVLSVRDDPDAWWRSVDSTILGTMRSGPEQGYEEWFAMARDLFAAGFDPDWDNPEAAKAAYERHNAAVRAAVRPERLLEFRPQDGWAPLCERLGLAVPEEAYPRTNTTEEWAARRAEQHPET